MGTRRSAPEPPRPGLSTSRADESILTERHARIKRVLVELHDYAFFHNPSEIGEVDDRFVGRERIAERLHTLMTGQQTKSGAYLVTGYRGVGKSSLVARVLSKVSSGEARSHRASRYFRIFFPLPFLAIADVRVLDPGFAWFFLVLLPAVFLVWALQHLIRKDPEARNLPAQSLSPVHPSPIPWYRRLPSWYRRIRSWCGRTRFRNAITMDLDRHPTRRARTLLQDYVFLSIIQIVALAVFWIRPLAVEWRLFTYLVLYLALVLVMVSLAVLKQARRRHGGERGTPRMRFGKVGLLARHLGNRVRNYFNYSHRVHIKINLGQDDLQEKDILRLIARNIHTKYLEFKKFGWTDLWWRTLYVLIIYFGVGLLYFYSPIYRLNQGARLESRFYFYFPSQVSSLLPGGPEQLDALLAGDLPEPGTEGPWPAIGLDGEDASALASFWERIETAWPAGRVREDAVHTLGTDRVQAVLTDPTWSPRRVVITVTNYADLFLYRAYRGVVTNLPGPLHEFPEAQANQVTQLLLDDLDFADEAFLFIPSFIDYFFVAYLLIGWLILRTLIRARLFGIVTHTVVIRELRDLNDAMDAQVTQDDSLSATSSPKPFAFLFSRRRTKVYPIANVREIEKRLLEILDEIDRVPRLTVRPHFIFIFDELDKIEPHQNVTLAQEDEEAAPVPGLDPALSSYGATRERQQRILQLLSNLKHFFTTAKAKFVFIAGREMFDASLADVSDRHFFIGSIFNDVINVPSFLRDASDNRLADVTSLTEAYLCRFLIPPDFPGDRTLLHTFDQYLRHEVFKEPESADEAERLWLRQRREKVVHEVFNFIVYLTYRSNGAPKKITRLLESYVVNSKADDLKDRAVLCAGRSSGNLYLEFNFYDQYTFGLITYLANPLFLSLNPANKDLGDKLLVSTSFLLDHLYKFHGFGFSWRNLELLPEIVDVNKAPELRSLISQILGFLGKTHLQPIVSGLHDFKFRKKITEEISFLSKVSESESAAFNFTLDESLPIKQYHNRKLRELLATYNSKAKLTRNAQNFVHSLAFVRMILGDLHFYDEEYDHAILQYMEAVQSLQHLDSVSPLPDSGAEPQPAGGFEKASEDVGRADGGFPSVEPDVRRLVLLIRNLLKLGLAFEKKKTYDSASLIYGKLTSYVVRFRNIDLDKIGLRAEWNEQTGKMMLHVAEKAKTRVVDPVEPLEEHNLDRMLDKLDFTPQIEDLAHKSGVFEGIRLLYQPLLAKLQIVEKASLGGISIWDVRRTDREFKFIVKMLDRQENFLVLAEFKNKVGDILYYKNGPECVRPEDSTEKREAKPKQLVETSAGRMCSTAFCLRSSETRCSPNRNAPTLWDLGRYTPCSACEYYVESLSEICDATLGKAKEDFKERSILYRLFHDLLKPRNRNKRWGSLRELANSLSDVGDTFLSCSRAGAEPPAERLSIDFLRFALSLVRSVPPEKSAIHAVLYEYPGARAFKKLEEAILYYILSAGFYKSVGEYKSHSHQLTKVLYVIREAVAIKAIEPKLGQGTQASDGAWKEIADRIEADLVSRIIRGIFRTYESTHRLEIEKLQAIFETGDQPRFLSHLVQLNNVSVSRELREVIVILQEIRLALTEDAPSEHRRFVSPYGLVNSMYNRIHELRYRGKVNYALLKGLGAETLGQGSAAGRSRSDRERASRRTKIFEAIRSGAAKARAQLGLPPEPGELKGREVLEHLIADSIFCFHQVLRCLQVFGLSYMANHSMRAAGHDKLAIWCDCYYEYLKLFQPNDPASPPEISPPEELSDVQARMEEQLSRLIGPADLVTITPRYHTERALLHYRSALQTHSQGRAYKQILEEMYYLDDDLNDELTHFCAAMERFRINAGNIESRVRKLSTKVKETSLHRAHNYFAGPPATQFEEEGIETSAGSPELARRATS